MTAAGIKEVECVHLGRMHVCVSRSSYYSKVNVSVKVRQAVISQTDVVTLRSGRQNESSLANTPAQTSLHPPC